MVVPVPNSVDRLYQKAAMSHICHVIVVVALSTFRGLREKKVLPKKYMFHILLVTYVIDQTWRSAETWIVPPTHSLAAKLSPLARATIALFSTSRVTVGL